MNKEQILALYGDAPMTFRTYYKYCFSFSGVAPDGAELGMDVGRSAEDIYRLAITLTKGFTLRDTKYWYASVHKGDEMLWEENRD